ncbi:hypothetical protein [Amycolatopsis sp. Hca4]|uniref:hypothetical protein n=1 Tax=Amycolatopsis sp. Hca4 TaxID=2742131 RepID=UPI0015910FFD|nr:hypothetical protein [Amycolatopsis sp. Hca4]QKV78032.1 hypothetical protein HUT10_32780 [Amycolatopsis sp. Hca4]
MAPRELVHRCLAAAVAGALATLVLKAFSPLELCSGPACFYVAVLAVPIMFSAGTAVAWGLMALARLRPAWPVAVVGPFVTLGLLTTVVDLGKWPFPLVSAAVGGGYAVAAVITADEVPRAWRVALGLPVVVLFAWGVVLPILL